MHARDEDVPNEEAEAQECDGREPEGSVGSTVLPCVCAVVGAGGFACKVGVVATGENVNARAGFLTGGSVLPESKPTHPPAS